jgi:hypothetical protein
LAMVVGSCCRILCSIAHFSDELILDGSRTHR